MELATSLSSVEPTPGLSIGIYLLLNSVMLLVLVTNEEKGEPKWKFRLDLLSIWIISLFRDYHTGHFTCWHCDAQLSGQRLVEDKKDKIQEKYFWFPTFPPDMFSLMSTPPAYPATRLLEFQCLCLTLTKSRPTSLTIALVAVNLLGLTQGMSVIRWL